MHTAEISRVATDEEYGVESEEQQVLAVAPAARAVDAVKVYGRGAAEVRALDGVTVDFAASRFTAIMGPSGSGKSTLTQLRRDRIGFVFQAFNLVPTLTAAENIRLPIDLAGRTPDREWFAHVVRTVGLGDRLRHRPSELSGGQQQRVAVARALASRPDIIFADEPTGNLDSRTGGEILSFMRTAVHDLGQTIVMVTHDPVAASYADRVIFLADGRLVDEMQHPVAEAVIDRMKRFGRDEKDGK
jgi:putative ABC transport system ATP-binding protein